MTKTMNRRGFLKTISMAAAGAALTLGAFTLPQALKSDDDKRIDKIYNTVKDLGQNTMSMHPCIDNDHKLRTGFGTLVSQDDLKNMDLWQNMSEMGNGDGMYTHLLEMSRYPTRITDYTFDSSSIRNHTKKCIKDMEPKIEKLVPNYKKLPTEAQGLLCSTELATREHLETMPEFCADMNAGNYTKAKKSGQLKTALNLFNPKHDIGALNQQRGEILTTLAKKQMASLNQVTTGR